MGSRFGVRAWGAGLLALSLLASGCGAVSSGTTVAPAPIADRVAAAITEQGLRDDLSMLAAAAGDAPPFRALGSPGYDRAVAKVEDVLRGAGWRVTEEVLSAAAFTDEGGTVLEVGGQSFNGPDVLPLIYAPGGQAEGPVVTVGWAAGAAAPGGAGCSVSDYGMLPAHAIVVVGPDDCYRRDAVTAAQSAGAAAFVAVMAGNPPGPPLRSTLITSDGLSIPAVAASGEAANALRAAAAAGGTARLASTAHTDAAQTRSIIAELPGATPDKVVMAGAHLDSVIDGPGINDNGTGVAALLGLARALSGTRPEATIQLAFWAGEEEGLLGSVHYVTGLSSSDRDKLVAYLNADMLGSPNGYAGVYEEPNGSPALRDLLESAITSLGAPWVPADTGGASDHAPFARSGVAVAGVFAGAGERLTFAQAQSFGGVAGQSADSCYHRACDTIANVKLPLARLLAAALALTLVKVAENPVLVGG